VDESRREARWIQADPDPSRAPAAVVVAGAPRSVGALRFAAMIALDPIGVVESPLTAAADAPKQGFEGAPEATLVLEARVLDALDGVGAGDELVVVTWLDRARRDVLRVHPRDDASNPLRGVFSTRSQDRPNPIGLHRITVVAIDGLRVRVRDLEALDGTPVLDIKSALR